MYKATRVVTVGVVLTAGFILAGCASAGQQADTSDHVVMCPKCETVWTRESRGLINPRNTHRFTYQRDMTCPTCDKMAAAYFEGDEKVLHDCPECKVTPKVYKPRKPMSHIGHKHQ